MTASMQVPPLLSSARSARCDKLTGNARPQALPLVPRIAPEIKTIRRTLVVTSTPGLHFRPAALLVRTLRSFACSITAENDGCVVDARSMLGLLSLAVGAGSPVTFQASGKEAAEAVQELERVFRSNFAEAY